jgi:hypothetical protein
MCVYIYIYIYIHKVSDKWEMNSIFTLSVRNPPKLWDKLIHVC